MEEIAFVALGGAIGSVSRYFTQSAVAKMFPEYPLGTLLVNIVGCVVIGILFPLLDRSHPAVKPLVMVGFLGGLTTMSSYAVEVVALAQSGRVLLSAVYGIGGVLVCVGAAAAGFFVGLKF